MLKPFQRIHWKNFNSTAFRIVFHTIYMEFNDRIFPESIDLQDIFHSIQLLLKIKIRFTFRKGPYNFHNIVCKKIQRYSNKYVRHVVSLRFVYTSKDKTGGFRNENISHKEG